MNTNNIKNWFIQKKYLLFINVTFIAFYFVFKNKIFEYIHSFFNQSKLHDSNIIYLQNLSNDLFIKISEMFALNSIVTTAATSKVGISIFIDINVQIGQILQNFSDMLQKGIEYIFLIIASIEFFELLLNIVNILSPFVFESIIISLFLWCFIALFYEEVLESKLVHNILKLMLSIFIFIHIALPYSIHISSKVSKFINTEFKHSINYEYYGELAKELAIKNHTKNQKLEDRAKSSVHFLEKTILKIEQKIQNITFIIIKSFIHQLVTMVIIPIVFAIIIYILFMKLIISQELVQNLKSFIKGSNNNIKKDISDVPNLDSLDKII